MSEDFERGANVSPSFWAGGSLSDAGHSVVPTPDSIPRCPQRPSVHQESKSRAARLPNAGDVFALLMMTAKGKDLLGSEGNGGTDGRKC